MPTHFCVQWSTAMKTVALPSPVVRQAVASVPHSSSGRSVVIVPSWFRGPRRRPTRVGASSPADWRGVQPREQTIKQALYEILGDRDEVERIFLVIKAQAEY